MIQQMKHPIASRRKKLIYSIASIGLLWACLGATFCYQLGKNGINNIDWMNILVSNIPVIIISTVLLITAFSKK